MKRILLSGLLGGIAGMVWITVSNAILPIKGEMIHQVAPNQMVVHEALVNNITEPGTYAIPYVGVEQEMAVSDYLELPVYTVIHSGFTHGDAGGPLELFAPLMILFVMALAGGGLLRGAHPGITRTYLKRVALVTAVGVVIALSDDLLQIFLGPQPKDYLIFLAINNVLTWLVMGLVIAKVVKPTTD